MERQHLPALAQATRELLNRRNLTVSGAARRFRLDRQSVTKMWDGTPPRLEVVEKFARAFGEDVNRWRALCGYAPLTYHPEAGAEPEAFDGDQSLADLPPEEREELRRIWLAMVRAKREKLGLPVEE